nr:MAG TPA: minor tail protein [Caudoviricetes sp.]
MAATKKVNILLALKDQFTKPLKNTTAEVKKQQKQIKAATSVINGWAKNANNKFKSVCGVAGKVGAAFLTLGGVISVANIKSWATDAMEGFNAAHEAETKLEAVLNNVPSIIAKGTGAAAAAKDNLVALTDKLEENGVVAGDVSVAGLQQLATFQLTEESLAKLVPGMADLVAQQKGLNATQSDAVSIGNLIGKAMTGQTGALSKAGIIMTKYQEKVMKTGNEEQRAAMMAEILQSNVGGVNAALAQTDVGKIQVEQNLLGRAQDEIGEKLVHLKANLSEVAAKYIPSLQKAAIRFIDMAAPKIEGAIAYIEAHKDTIRAGIDKIGTAVSAAYQVVSKALGWIKGNGKTLIPVLGGIVAGFVAFNAVTAVVSTVTGTLATLTTVVKGVSAAGGVLNAIMAANPILLVALAIAALVAAGIALWQNWDTVKAKAQELWGKVKEVFGGIRDSITGAFDTAKAKVTGVIDWIHDKISGIGEAIEKVPVLGTLFKGIKGAAVTVKNAVTGRHNATGNSFFPGGATSINEGGRGEIVDLPSGTRIIPHDVAKKSAGRSIILNLKLIIQGNVIGNKEYMEQTGEYVANKVIEALGTV